MKTTTATVPATTSLHAASIGYLVPAHDFTGMVHSVFARACNVAVAGSLLTLAARPHADAPTHIVLRDGVMPDLRVVLRRGMWLKRRGPRLVGHGVTVHLASARAGSRCLRATSLPRDRVRDNVSLVTELVASRARTPLPMRSALKKRAAALEAAVAQCDAAAMDACTSALVGLGEGLTPSGDDFLVGLLAGLELLAEGEPRRRFLSELRRSVEAQVGATTDLSAHQLRLAASGHFCGVLDRLRNLIVSEPDTPSLAAALQQALDFGATSGADTVEGLLAGLRAWLRGASSGAHS